MLTPNTPIQLHLSPPPPSLPAAIARRLGTFVSPVEECNRTL